jgi:hypothetical protein
MQSSAAGYDRIDHIQLYTRARPAMRPGLLAQRPNQPRHVPKRASQASWPLLDIIESSEPGFALAAAHNFFPFFSSFSFYLILLNK